MDQTSSVSAAPDLGNSINLYSFAFVLFLMLLGATIHWAKLRHSGRTRASLLAYIFTDNIAASAKAGGSIFAVAAAAAGTGVADWIDPVMLWQIVISTHTMPSICFFGIGAAVAGGYMLDSGVNATTNASVAAKDAEPSTEKEQP